MIEAVPTAILDRYHSGKGVFHKYDQTNHVGNDYQRKIIAPFLSLVQAASINSQAIIGDLACGKGEFGGYINVVYPAAQVISLDISQEGLANATGNRIRARAENIPFADNTLTALHCKDALAHIFDKRKLLTECMRALKPGGYFICSSATYTISYFQYFDSKKNIVSGGIPFLSPEAYIELADKYEKKGKIVGPPYFPVNSKMVIAMGKDVGFDVINDIPFNWNSSDIDWYASPMPRFVVVLQKPQ